MVKPVQELVRDIRIVDNSNDQRPMGQTERVVSPSSPKISINDRLKQPKLQQKLNVIPVKCKSPDPNENKSSPTGPFQDTERNNRSGVNFRLGNFCYILLT